MAAQERAQATLLDISSATGKLSFIAVDCGFGRVISTEIRKNQCEQERLILESITENKYQKAITIVHDPISADVVDYPQRYLGDMRPDVVLSSGLLYHLTNPLQHLVNLYRITKRYAIITTQTHYHPLATKMWGLTVEDKTWITKATESVSWIPHYLDVRRRCQEVGFKSVKMVYPDIFIKNFPDYDKDTSLKTAFMVTAMALHKTTGLRIGFMRNHDFAYYQYTNMNPNYFTYICEK